tara:strand:+ start:362 stop:496 length:135 start_codon:yes stop_codon:yes gene_type:complete
LPEVAGLPLPEVAGLPLPEVAELPLPEVAGQAEQPAVPLLQEEY